MALQKIYYEIFKAYDYEIIDTALNGIEAVQKFQLFSKKPDFIIMDYRMPLKNGIEATKEIIALNSRTKIIFASADSSIKELALSSGAISFLEKPFDIDNLISLIEEIIQII